MKTVLKFLKPYMGSVLFCLIIKAVSSISELAIPRMLAIIIDEDVPSGEIKAVLRSGAIMLGFAVLTLLFNVVGNKVSGYTTGKIARDLRAELFKRTANLSTEQSDRVGISSLTSRLTTDTYNITQFLARIQRIGIKAPLTLIVGIIITLTIDPRLSLILIVLLPIVSLTVFLITKRAIPLYNEEQQLLDGIVRRVDETASGIRVIKALSKTEFEKERFSGSVDAVAKKEVQAGKVMSLTKPINDFLFYMGFCAVILVGYYISLKEGEAAAGKLLAFMTYFTVILNSMIMMSRVFIQGSKAFASGARIEAILLTEESLTNVELPDSRDEGYIVFDKVSFSYNKKSDNLKDVSFSLKKGQTLGIIGATGSGKSTLLSLLLRLYDADSGNIYIDGRNVKSIPSPQLRSMFGVVFQNDFIFAGSVRDNIDFFRGIDEAKLFDAIDIAQADFVYSLKDGIDSQLTTGATNLSGGQKQRLLIARALAGEPEILLLDDCSSALDYRTDAKLRRAVRERSRATSVIVSQRVASVMHADLILVLDDGRVIGSGRHEELIAACDEYRDIAEVQGI